MVGSSHLPWVLYYELRASCLLAAGARPVDPVVLAPGRIAKATQNVTEPSEEYIQQRLIGNSASQIEGFLVMTVLFRKLVVTVRARHTSAYFDRGTNYVHRCQA